MSKNTPATILIVDDEDSIRETLIDILEDEGYRTLSAENAETARAQYSAHHPALTLLDIWMPDTDGISLLREWQQENQLSGPVIMMSGHGTIETAVEATKLGAYYFLEKPLSTSKLLLTVERALQTQALMAQNAALKAQIDPPIEIIGKSPLIQQLREQAQTLAQQNIPLLLTGAAGSGKQQTARYIHQKSPWQDGKFIIANLSTLDANNIVPALLGTDKHQGLIAQAANGTLYLDDISQLPSDAQSLLANLLTYKSYHPANSSQQQPINLRLIAASRLPLHLLQEHLTPALLEQLTIAPLSLPNLKDHSADVPELLEHFSKTLADSEQLPYRHFTLAAQNALRQHSWPGNIRELKNLVQRLLIQSDAPEIDTQEAEAALNPISSDQSNTLWSQIIPQDMSLREAREEFERQYLREQFRYCDGNVAKLANRVGMDRTNLYRKLRSLNIDPTEKPQ